MCLLDMIAPSGYSIQELLTQLNNYCLVLHSPFFDVGISFFSQYFFYTVKSYLSIVMWTAKMLNLTSLFFYNTFIFSLIHFPFGHTVLFFCFSNEILYYSCVNRTMENCHYYKKLFILEIGPKKRFSLLNYLNASILCIYYCNSLKFYCHFVFDSF